MPHRTRTDQPAPSTDPRPRRQKTRMNLHVSGNMLRKSILLSVALVYCCGSNAEKLNQSYTAGGKSRLAVAFLYSSSSSSNNNNNNRQNKLPSSSRWKQNQEMHYNPPQRSSTEQKSTSSSDVVKENKVFTLEDLEEFALQEGLELSKTTLGPGFRVVARSTQDQSKILGYGEGFVRPSGSLLHLDKVEMFKPIVKQVKKESPDFRGGGTIFGVSLILGYQMLLHGVENGCTEAEFLAIDDEDFQHKRLVKFYKNAGFKIIKYVGEDFQDIPDRLVWGGCGTLMRANIGDLLSLWSQLFMKSVERGRRTSQ